MTRRRDGFAPGHVGPPDGAVGDSGAHPAVMGERNLLLRLGLPRDPAATSHLTGFLVATVATVLLTRAMLAALGYPQLGGDGLHVAHVLWGGLLMALAFVVLLSFAGPVARPVGALVGGIGFGLFVDEVGKFVTSDNDYFYEPTAALIYCVVVVLVLLGEALHGRSAHHPAELVAGAADHAVSGLVGGFTPHARSEAHELLERAGPRTPGVAQTRALLDVVPHDTSEVPDVIGAVQRRLVRGLHRLVAARWVAWFTVVMLVGSALHAVWRGVLAWSAGGDVPTWMLLALVVSGGTSALLALVGLAVVRRDRRRGWLFFRRAVLVSLLVTEVFLFRIQEWAATAELVVDLVLLGLIVAELSQLAEDGAQPEARSRRRVSGRS